MTVAALLARYPDVDVHLFESKPEIRAIGAGIAVWKRFWDIFEEYMDMDELCASKGIRCTPWSEGTYCNCV